LNWKLLFKGMGVIWLCACGVLVLAYIHYEPGYQQKEIFLGIGSGVLGYAVMFVIAAACPEKKK